MYQAALAARGLGPITTEIVDAGAFYFAEAYHQQYLAKILPAIAASAAPASHARSVWPSRPESLLRSQGSRSPEALPLTCGFSCLVRGDRDAYGLRGVEVR